MRIVIKKDYTEVSEWVANYVADKINKANPGPQKPFVLGLPTGSSPVGTYKKLIEIH
jgi:glucosamine-6-phosphate deaminase